MDNPLPKSPISNAPTSPVAGGAGGGNLLSSVSPPAQLPNFVTASAIAPVIQPTPSVIHPHVAQPSVIHAQGQPVSVIQTQAQPTSVIQPVTMMQEMSAAQASTSEIENFSPAIPLSVGVPSLPPRSPDDSQATEQSASLPGSSPDVDRLGDVMPGAALFSWMKDAVSTGGILHKVAEKAKSSVDTMITTLDPQMREYLNSGGDLYIVVASDKDVKVSPVREAFQAAFGKATIVGIPAQSEVTASQPVGGAAAYAAAKQRIADIRSSRPEINNNVPVVAIESYLHEAMVDRWFDTSLLVLSQPSFGIEVQVQSQSTPVPSAAVAAMKDATPADYPHVGTGYCVTVGQIMADNLKIPHTQWHEATTGVSRREMLVLAARSLAGCYKKMLAISAAES